MLSYLRLYSLVLEYYSMRWVLDGKLFVIYHSRNVFFIRSASANCVVNFSLNSVFF